MPRREGASVAVPFFYWRGVADFGPTQHATTISPAVQQPERTTGAQMRRGDGKQPQHHRTRQMGHGQPPEHIPPDNGHENWQDGVVGRECAIADA